MFERALIVGVGLMGGSLGMAIRRKGLAKTVVGLGRSADKLRRAKELGAIDEYGTGIGDVADGCDLVVMCTPVELIPDLAFDVAGDRVFPGCVFTDVGSVKGNLCEYLDKRMPAHTPFVGSHPIAGAAEAGVEHARADLYDGHVCIITPTPATDAAAKSKITDFWKRIGMRVEEMSPAEHDAVLASISHLPHMIAYALFDAALEADKIRAGALQMAAGGLKDTTRIAQSPGALWARLLTENRDEVMKSLGRFEQSLGEIRRLVEAGDIGALSAHLEQIAASRRKLGSS